MKSNKKAIILAGLMLAVLSTASVDFSLRNILQPTNAVIQTQSPHTSAPPSPPVLSPISPNPNTIGNIFISWSAVTGANYYRVYVSTSPIVNTSSSGIFDVNYEWDTTRSDFESNGVYYYAVTTVSGGLESATSNCESVTVAATAPASPPVLAAITPNPTHNYYVLLSWSAVSNVAGYRVYESATPINSSNIGSIWSWSNVYPPETTMQYYVSQNGTYYFAVVAYNAGGTSLSNCQSVVVVLFTPHAPVLLPISPNPNTVGSITLSWNAVAGANWYYVYESTSPLTNTNITNYQYEKSMSTSSTSYTDSELNGMHYYVITAGNSSGHSNCSNCQSVMVNAIPPATAPVLSVTSPNPSHSRTISLAWSAVSNVVGYRVYYSNSPINSSNIGSVSYWNVLSPGTTLDYQVSGNGTYYLVVVAYNGGGYSSLSNCLSVLVVLFAPRAPVLSVISPNPNTVGNITLTWSAAAGANNYYLYVSTSPITSTTSSGIFHSYWISGTSVHEFEPNGVYYYAVTAYNDSGESSCSNCQSVTVNAVAPTTAPVLSPISPTLIYGEYLSLSWSAVSNAAGYRVYVSGSPINSSNIGSLSSWSTVDTPQTTDQYWVHQNGTYYFAIVAFNGGGTSAPSNCQSVVVVLYTPHAPVLSAISPNPNTLGNIALSWNAVSGASYYYVLVSMSPITDIYSGGIIHNYFVMDTSYTDFELNGVYYYAVVAANNSGYSACSNCESVTVNALPVTSAPVLSAISPNPSNSPHVTLSWSAVSNAAGYDVYRSSAPINSSNIGSLSPIDTVLSPTTTYMVNQPTNGTYFYAIVAYNGGGTSPPSNCQSVTIRLTPIPMGTYVGVVPGNSFSYLATIFDSSGTMPFPGLYNGTYTWVLTVDNATDLGRSTTIGYHAVFSNATNSSIYVMYGTATINADDTDTSLFPAFFINKNIANKTFNIHMTIPSYSAWLNATWDNSGVMTTFSEMISSGSMVISLHFERASPSTPPSAPQNLQASAGIGHVALSWQSPASNGGAPVNGYKIYRGTSPGGETLLVTVGNVTTYNDTSVVNGQTYYYVIRAINGAGDGTQSNEASATPYTIPSVPQYLQASPGNGQVMLSWQAPASNGGASITNYSIYRGTSSGNEVYLVTTGNVHTFTDTGVTNGQAYYYRIDAVNLAGNSTLSTEASATPLSSITSPSAPRNVQASAGNGQVLLTWQPPASNGSSIILYYNIYRGISPGSETFLVTVGNVTLYTDSELNNGQIYYYKITAINGAGEGPLSNETSAKPCTVPTGPRNFHISAGNGQVTLSWQAPGNNGGLPVTGYKIYRGTSPGSETLLATVGNMTAYTDIGLNNGHLYYYTIRAINGAGEGPQSTEMSAVPCTVPSAPRNFHVSAGNGELMLSWQAPEDNGGTPVTGYKIYRGTSPGSETYLASVENITTYADTSVTSGQTYYYTICAINGAGEGTPSSEASAMLPTTNFMLFIIVAVIGGIAIISIGTAAGVRKRKAKHVTRAMPTSLEMNLKRQSLQQAPMAGTVPPQPIVQVGAPPQPIVQVGAPPQPIVQVGAPPQPIVQVGAPPQPIVQVGPIQKLYEILLGQKTTWEPFDLASDLGFKDDLERFYTFVAALNGDTMRFFDGKIWIDLTVDQGKKIALLQRFRLFLSQLKHP